MWRHLRHSVDSACHPVTWSFTCWLIFTSAAGFTTSWDNILWGQSPLNESMSQEETASAERPPYWQAPPLPSAVISGSTIPADWVPEPVPYTGMSPDGKPFTRYFSPTYTFTYTIGPPITVMPKTTQVPVNRKQAPGYQPPPATTPGWMYPSQGAPPAGYVVPSPTTVRYRSQNWQYPPGSPQLSGERVVPPAQ